jgi:hypothetical protein
MKAFSSLLGNVDVGRNKRSAVQAVESAQAIELVQAIASHGVE